MCRGRAFASLAISPAVGGGLLHALQIEVLSAALHGSNHVLGARKVPARAPPLVQRVEAGPRAAPPAVRPVARPAAIAVWLPSNLWHVLQARAKIVIDTGNRNRWKLG